ncbi:hypothetical protein N0V83_003529 [Neocucurbitaria cava]|uniref:Uncharacterized protein n=1 Tax=Neocucurbitaria cava TaxID=798079 RepID=A0A9W8YBK5_9PLEO|nr:hypothetical protein N0V83_003529 [Neocucurbitaria cava]
MDPDNQTQPQSPVYDEYPIYPFHHYDSIPVEPCSPLANSLANKSGFFHLLRCGHIVVVAEQDGRCGRNCQRASASAYAGGMMGAINPVASDPYRYLDPDLLGTTLTPLSADPPMDVTPTVSETQLDDTLYCEVCQDIPYDRYVIMHPPEDPLNIFTKKPEHFRRCFSLSSELLKSTANIDDERVDRLLCRPFIVRTHRLFNPNNTHVLRCGHEVWCPEIRSCASNCRDEPQCSARVTLGLGKRGDMILCHECVSRAELVYVRYQRLNFMEESTPETIGISEALYGAVADEAD